VLGTGAYVTAYAEGVVSTQLLPIVIFIISGFVAFAIGTSWGTMSIMTPIVIPLAWNISGGSAQFIPVVLGAMFSGAIFGDNCSPISDTTILASTFAGSDHIDHVRTQMYYAGTVFIVAVILFLFYGFTNLTPLILLPAGFAMLFGLVHIFSKWDAQRKDLLAKPAAAQSPKPDPANDD
jgi:Na+/H+ antiporter NhaC